MITTDQIPDLVRGKRLFYSAGFRVEVCRPPGRRTDDELRWGVWVCLQMIEPYRCDQQFMVALYPDRADIGPCWGARLGKDVVSVYIISWSAVSVEPTSQEAVVPGQVGTGAVGDAVPGPDAPSATR